MSTDPADDLPGTVRRIHDGRVWVAVAGPTALEKVWRWDCPTDGSSASDDDVAHGVVIGAVPGTPAAQAAPDDTGGAEAVDARTLFRMAELLDGTAEFLEATHKAPAILRQLSSTARIASRWYRNPTADATARPLDLLCLEQALGLPTGDEDTDRLTIVLDEIAKHVERAQRIDRSIGAVVDYGVAEIDKMVAQHGLDDVPSPGPAVTRVGEVLAKAAEWRVERDALSTLLRGMARRLGEVRQEMRFATRHVDAWRVHSQRLRTQRDSALAAQARDERDATRAEADRLRAEVLDALAELNADVAERDRLRAERDRLEDQVRELRAALSSRDTTPPQDDRDRALRIASDVVNSALVSGEEVNG